MFINDGRYNMFATVALVVAFVLLTSIFPEKFIKSEDRDYLFVSIPSTSNETYEALFPANTDSVIIPLKKAGRLLLIDAVVEDQTGNLVFDTGASGLVLNSTYFREHVRTTGKSTGGVTGAVGKVERISIDKMQFGNLIYQKLRADLVNLGHIENRRGVKILGLVGFGIMKDLEIVLNAENGELRLYKLDKSGNRISGKMPVVAPDYFQKIESNGNVLFLKGAIAGKSLNFCFDTGAETNAISSDANKNILSTLTVTRRMELKGAGASKSEVLFGRMNDFSMGEKQITGMETIITSLYAMSEAYNTKIDGMLGYSFLEQGTISINFVKRQFGINFKKESGK